MIKRDGRRLYCQAHPLTDFTEAQAVTHLRDEHPSVWRAADAIVGETVRHARSAHPLVVAPAGGWPEFPNRAERRKRGR